MEKKILQFTCVQCPMGCPLTVTMEGDEVLDVQGNTCPRGAKYGRQEATCPERVVTSLLNVDGDWHPISVKTSAAVPKERIADVVNEIRGASVEPPVAIGDVVIKGVAGLDVDVVATSPHR